MLMHYFIFTGMNMLYFYAKINIAAIYSTGYCLQYIHRHPCCADSRATDYRVMHTVLCTVQCFSMSLSLSSEVVILPANNAHSRFSSLIMSAISASHIYIIYLTDRGTRGATFRSTNSILNYWMELSMSCLLSCDQLACSCYLRASSDALIFYAESFVFFLQISKLN